MNERTSTSAGRVLALITIAPALLIAAWLAVSLPLLLAGAFHPAPAIALFVPVAAVMLRYGLRFGTPGGGEPGESSGPDGSSGGPGVLDGATRWTLAGVLSVVGVFTVYQVFMLSEQIIVRRDPASYVQFAVWLAEHGSLPIPQDRWAFGGADPALGFESPAFYAEGGAIVPQFMAGFPLVLAPGGWLAGAPGVLLTAPLLGACCVLAFAGLVARLVGPRWAPAGALLLAACLPMLWASRNTLSELPAIVLLLGGLSLIHDARGAEPRAARAKYLLAGLALGLIVLVRIDGLRDVLPILALAGLLAGLRRPAGYWLAGGLVLGAAAGLIEGVVLSRPYLEYLRGSVVPLLVIATAVAAATVLLAVLLRADRTGGRLRALAASVRGGRLPNLLAGLTVAVFLAFAARPLFQTVTRVPDNPDDRLNAQFIEAVQKINGMPLDGTRQYTELSLYWVAWYVGVPALLFAVVGAAVLGRRLLRGRSAQWLPAYAVIVWTTTQVLLRPGITPDHPWASRRLIGLVIPGLLLFALFGAAWTARRVRRLGYSPRVLGWGKGVGFAVVLVPIVLVSAPYLVSRTEQGEVAAVRGLCDRLGPDASVIAVERATADRFLQVVRGMCGVPAARTADGATPGDVRRVIGKVRAAGRTPVLLGARRTDVAPYGPAEQVIAISTRQDGRTLNEPPRGTWGLGIDVWTSRPTGPGVPDDGGSGGRGEYPRPA
ncbi:hypothetical protein [Actinomadura sp. WMMB 499]|uniref:hypothetical protein n=1 Tax=Actinomadura sp. WMMB 499 TaxID=1219491 RepID=UPI001244136B|nr:hypothetical protein [Actinomadura sp. WMMB 499]QFG21737.1 hypothetical protein F7P10_11925 [Actinomadura sp. WMMB 499]